MASCPCLRPPRPLQAKPFFFAARKISTGRGESLPLRPKQAKLFSLPHRCSSWAVSGQSLQRLPSLPPEIRNRCTQEVVNGHNLAAIPKLTPEIKNHCTQEGQSLAFLAAIPDFSPRISNHCSARSLSLDIPAANWSETWCRGRGMPDGQGLRTA